MIRVLVIDDEPQVRDNLAAFLEDDGFLVHTAASAEEGMEALARQDFDAAVVDMRLPGMCGRAFIAQALGARPGLVVLIHTGSTAFRLDPELIGLGIGQDQVFAKPVPDMAVFSRAIRRRSPAR